MELEAIDFRELDATKIILTKPFDTGRSKLVQMQAPDGDEFAMMTPILRIGKDIDVAKRPEPAKKGKGKGKGEVDSNFHPYEGTLALVTSDKRDPIVPQFHKKLGEIDDFVLGHMLANKDDLWGDSKSVEKIKEEFRSLKRDPTPPFGSSLWTKIAMADDTKPFTNITTMVWGEVKGGKPPRDTPPNAEDLTKNVMIRAVLKVNRLYIMGDKWGYNTILTYVEVWQAPKGTSAPSNRRLPNYGQSLPTADDPSMDETTQFGAPYDPDNCEGYGEVKRFKTE